MNGKNEEYYDRHQLEQTSIGLDSKPWSLEYETRTLITRTRNPCEMVLDEE
jgi:hypothetical protein